MIVALLTIIVISLYIIYWIDIFVYYSGYSSLKNETIFIGKSDLIIVINGMFAVVTNKSNTLLKVFHVNKPQPFTGINPIDISSWIFLNKWNDSYISRERQRLMNLVKQ